MTRKIYLDLLILCAVLSQGIAASEENVDVEKSSDLQIRKKRVINESANGSILSAHVVLTVAHCLGDNLQLYHVYSGSEKTTGGGGQYHKVISKLDHPLYQSDQYENALSLITIEPSVHYIYNGRIELQSGPTLPGVRGIVAGWGCNRITPNGREYPEKLQEIEVRVISLQECKSAYKNDTTVPFPIGENEICTLGISGQERCSHGDTGTPLIIFRQLAGLFIWSADKKFKPDIFVSLEHPLIHLWVSSNIQNIESHIHNSRFQSTPTNPHHLPYPQLPLNSRSNHHH